MKSIAAWFSRLAEATADSSLAVQHFRMILPAGSPLDLDGWLLATERGGPLPESIHSVGPELLEFLHLPDVHSESQVLDYRHRLASELAALFSLALGRRVSIKNELAFRHSENQVTFMPFSQVVDQGLDAPIPQDAVERIKKRLLATVGLSDDDQEVLGAACAAYHGALILFDKEPRAAYTLLITGIEVLSRRYGQPPTHWSAWESADEWDAFFEECDLLPQQSAALREKLLRDKQLRLGLTFRNYASSRPASAFWRQDVEQWFVGLDANSGKWLPKTKGQSHKISDYVTEDRGVLRRRLGQSYQLRSSLVHESTWVELMSLARPIPGEGNTTGPLPFPVLRYLLADLIDTELLERSGPRIEPDFKYFAKEPR